MAAEAYNSTKNCQPRQYANGAGKNVLVYAKPNTIGLSMEFIITSPQWIFKVFKRLQLMTDVTATKNVVN